MKKSPVLSSSVEEEGNMVWAAKLSLLLRMSVPGDSESQYYALLQYLFVNNAIDTVEEKLGCVCVRLSTDVEVDYSVVRGFDALGRGCLRRRYRYEVVNLETLQCYVNVPRA